MNWGVALARAGLAGLVWGIAYGGPVMLGYHFPGDPPRLGDLSRWIRLLEFVPIAYIPLGFVLAVPYAVFLGVWETYAWPGNRPFLAGSLVVSAFWAAVLADWFWGVIAMSYGPDYGFTGPQRLTVAGFTAALVAGYVAGRCLPQTGENPAQKAYDRYRDVLWLGLFWGLFVPGIFWPVFAAS